MYGLSIVSLCFMAIEKLIYSSKLTINLTKSVDCENEVKVMWHMPGWHVSSMINVWTKYTEPRLYGNEEADLIKN
jgi:hypothetical protein